MAKVELIKGEDLILKEYGITNQDLEEVPDLEIRTTESQNITDNSVYQKEVSTYTEEESANRIAELEENSKNLTFNELDDMMVELRTKHRKSQIENMSVPIITDRDFMGIFLMEMHGDRRYSHSVSSGVDVWRRKVNGSTWNGVARGVIPNITPRRMCTLYWDYAIRRKWDSFYTVIEDVDFLPSGDRVSRTATWTPKMFKQRDYVHVRNVIESDDCCVGVYLPADHKRAEVDKKKFIRGLVNFSGFVFRKQGNDCVCTLMTQTDISIPLPDFLINKFLGIAIGWYIRLMKKSAINDGIKQYVA
ncbi:hypothetical protein EIN_432600 [Entamoeba invadens IP1]|uniref:START domain-containing protein n=1 Tax=Entamoeba invadens IP1 TaxID=370355 RepID=A0A0A1UCZ5_ENTIV|nr:hypothetical protein EIN_432600 [Entamoeba invadens IP1]ELP93708.1 hypothetical protein EIN_432600 [Entamoeba invadens IP1]|eukprot:XP_004260479.1 hypothetical protein EIN_432600 [Entamoeba invadens IP1]